MIFVNDIIYAVFLFTDGGKVSIETEAITTSSGCSGIETVKIYVRHSWWPKQFRKDKKVALSKIYVKRIKKLIGEIFGKQTGRAALEEVVRFKKTVFIIPRVIGTTVKSTTKQGFFNASARAHDKFGAESLGRGSHVTVPFLPQAWGLGGLPVAFTPDTVLLHELIHALRMTVGTLTLPDPVLDPVVDWRHVPKMGWKSRELSPDFKNKWKNIEEFIAVLVVNIYRSEKGQGLRARYSGANKHGVMTVSEQRKFASDYGQIIDALIRDHADFARKLRDVRAPFNPVRDRLVARGLKRK